MRLIEHEDYTVIRTLAKKYNMNVADFGRSIVRQSERSVARAIRLTEDEYNYITQTAKDNNMSAARFCALACHSFLEEKIKYMPTKNNAANINRTKRIEARLYNGTDEAELIKYATAYSIKISSLIRYCAVRFDGNCISMKGEL